MKQTGSSFVTKAGILLQLLLLLAAAYFQVDALVILLLALLCVSLLAYAWTLFSLSRLELRTELPYAEGFPGEELTLRTSLTNRKLLPVIWLKLSMPQQSASVSPPEPDGTLRRFLWIMPYQTLTWSLTVHAERRGIWRVETLLVTSGDGFGLAEQERKITPAAPFELVVFPKLTAVNISLLRRHLQDPEIVPLGQYEDVTLLRHVRDYQFGDPARSLNWRQLARTGQLMVNIYERQEIRHIALALDPESFVYTELVKYDGGTRSVRRLHGAAFEETVSLLASAALALLDDGLYVTLYVPQGRICAPNAHADRKLLYALAQLDPLSTPAKLPDETTFAGRHQDGPLFLFTKTAGARICDWLETFRPLSPHVLCYDGTELSDPALWPMDVIR